MADRAPLPVEVRSTLAVRLSPHGESTAYFVVAEALTNAAKHSGAEHVDVVLATSRRHLVVSVTDDGRGGTDPEAGSGLTGLADRLAAVGGRLSLFRMGMPSSSLVEFTSGLVPDPLNHGWRDYGNRVGIWRVIDCLDRHGLRASALLNSDVTHHYPQIIDAAGNGTGPGSPTVGLTRYRTPASTSRRNAPN